MGLTHFPHGISSLGIPVVPYNVNPFAPVYFVDGTNGNNGNDGLSSEKPYRTMAKAFAQLVGGETIFLIGKINEQLVTPANIFGVKIIGCGNQPYFQDTADASHPAGADGHAAQWKGAGLVAATANLRIIQQGWQVENILFTMVDANAAGIELVRNAGSGDLERDASVALIRRNHFRGAGIGIRLGVAGLFTEIVGHGIVEDNAFYNMTTALSGVNGDSFTFRRNHFQTNTNHASLAIDHSTFYDNFFGLFTTKSLGLSDGVAGGNIVTGNYLSGTYTAAHYPSATSDEWSGNWSSDEGDAKVTNAITVGVATT